MDLITLDSERSSWHWCCFTGRLVSCLDRRCEGGVPCLTDKYVGTHMHFVCINHCWNLHILAEVMIHWYPMSSSTREGLCVSMTVKYMFQAYIHVENKEIAVGLMCGLLCIVLCRCNSCSINKINNALSIMQQSQYTHLRVFAVAAGQTLE